jgi:ribosomal protein RSM22 (predicted rRNA methylase)
MNLTYPGSLDLCVRELIEAPGGLSAAAAELSATYRKGRNSREVDVRAYLAARVPATFAANQRAMQEISAVLPDFSPVSMLDLGTGPGTACWSALAAWPSLQHITQCEQDPNFAALATKLNAASNLPALATARLLRSAERAIVDKADLVVASYMLAEMPLETMAETATRMWARAQQVLLLIEPGTPQGFARLRTTRDTLLRQGAHVIAPCTHQLSCPMIGDDWCHFKVRLSRSRAHMHAKNATVPFEDEPFSYLVLSRTPRPQSGARVIGPPVTSKIGVKLRLCEDGKVEERMIAARDKADYKRAKKIDWGVNWIK